MRPLLSFVAIFKDEAANVRATLESVRPYVDWWFVLDTGSTDGTQDIVREVMSPLPGSLWESSFIDFATNRNHVLDVADEECSPVFTLMLSGDETLRGGAELRAFLETHRESSEGAYCVEMQSETRVWPYTRILRTDSDWRYVGEVHERPVGPDGEVGGPLIPGVRVVHAPTDPERKARRLREFDLPVLARKVEDEAKSLDDRARAMFFLAETHAALSARCGDEPGGPKITHQLAAMSYYWRYAQIAENPAHPAYEREKAMYAYFLYYHLADKAGFFTSEELVPRLEILCDAAPHMPGARFLLAEHAAHLDVRRGLFLAEEAAAAARAARANLAHDATDDRFEWLSLRVAAICAKKQGQDQRARELAKQASVAGAPSAMLEGLL